MIRVLIAEDQGIVRGALATLISLEPDLDVVAQVATGDRVLPAARETRPDIALVDIEMPGLDGLSAAAALHAELPHCRILILTTFGRPGYLRRAMDAGANGFMVKDGPVEELIDAIHRVINGEQVINPALATAALTAGPNPLSHRERAVLAVAARGATAGEIAQELHLSAGTVRNYLSAAIGKTGSRNRSEALRVAINNGWL